MEMHHRLRRDPGWHPNSCNICGQMGHQAAQCATGTINWRAMYGDAALRLAPTVFPSDLEAAKKARRIDFAELEASARRWAEGRAAAAAAAAAGGGAPPPRPPEEAGLPGGWAVAVDAQGRTYYWHRETKAVQWTRPGGAAEEPAAAPAASGGEAQQQPAAQDEPMAAAAAEGAAEPGGEAAAAAAMDEDAAT